MLRFDFFTVFLVLPDFLHPYQNEASELKMMLIALKVVRVTTSLSLLVPEGHPYAVYRH